MRAWTRQAPTSSPACSGDLTEAIRSRDEVRSATLRMALTAVRSEEVAGTTARTLSDDDVVVVLGREAKKRREAVDGVQRGRPARTGRARERRAGGDRGLPARAAVRRGAAGIVAEAVAEVRAAGADGPAAMGRVMKAVQPRTKGLADGGRVAAEVRRQLAS